YLLCLIFLCILLLYFLIFVLLFFFLFLLLLLLLSTFFSYTTLFRSLPAFNFVFFRSSKCPVAEHIGSIIQHSYIFSYAADRQRVVYDAAGPKISLLN